jgi:hypothetical protein
MPRALFNRSLTRPTGKIGAVRRYESAVISVTKYLCFPLPPCLATELRFKSERHVLKRIMPLPTSMLAVILLMQHFLSCLPRPTGKEVFEDEMVLATAKRTTTA